MKTSFVITFHTSKINNFLQTLRFLVRNFPEVPESQLTTICLNTIDFLPYEYCEEFKSVKQAFYHAEHFDANDKRSECLHHGICYSSSDKIIVLECDRIAPKGYSTAALEQVKPNSYVCCKNIKKITKPATDDEILSNSYETIEETKSGVVTFWKQDYFRIGIDDFDAFIKTDELQKILLEETELRLWSK